MTNRVIAGRYHLASPLGQGAMGVVWRAHDARLDRDVALKLVEAAPTGTAAGGDSALERFRREAVATARLDHPNIVAVFDAGTDGPAAYLVMELVPGMSVAALLAERGRLPLADALRIGSDVAAALSAAHAAGLVHRDIKPANVMVGGGRVTVLDFGVAHLQGADLTLSEPATAIGTAAYMAPEQAAGAKVGPATDTYALGCLLTTMVTGRPPFAGDNAIAVATQQISSPPPRLSSRLPVPAALDDLVARMLSKKAFDRPDGADVQRILRAVLADKEAALVGPGRVTPDSPAATAVLTGPAGSPDPAAPPHGAPPVPGSHPTAVLPPAATPLRRAATPGAVPGASRAPATAVMPALPPAVAAATAPTGYQTYERNPMPGERRARWRLPVALLVLALLGGLAFTYAYGVAGERSRAAAATTAGGRTSASPGPSTSTPVRPSSSAPTAAPTSAARPATSAARPSAGSTLAVLAATRAVSGVLDSLPDGKAKDQLTKSWNQSAPHIIAGRNAAQRLQGFSDEVTGFQQSGELSLREAIALLAAVEAVKLLI